MRSRHHTLLRWSGAAAGSAALVLGGSAMVASATTTAGRFGHPHRAPDIAWHHRALHRGQPPRVLVTVPADRAPQITSPDQVGAVEGTPFGFVVTSVGYPAATLSETGALPTGLTFADNGNGTATISGDPTVDQVATIAVGADNGVGLGASQNLTITVGQPPAFTSAATASATVGSPFSFTVSTTGSPVATLSETGALPAGVSFVDNGDGTATLSGDPSAGGTTNLTLSATNGVGPAVDQSFALIVGPATSGGSPVVPPTTTAATPPATGSGSPPCDHHPDGGWSSGAAAPSAASPPAAASSGSVSGWGGSSPASPSPAWSAPAAASQPSSSAAATTASSSASSSVEASTDSSGGPVPGRPPCPHSGPGDAATGDGAS
ncbi:MAG TPA: hypothetical protein VGL60_06625 [Acidimicrobiales bacterium]